MAWAAAVSITHSIQGVAKTGGAPGRIELSRFCETTRWLASARTPGMRVFFIILFFYDVNQ
jgi:hypothetical protein